LPATDRDRLRRLLSPGGEDFIVEAHNFSATLFTSMITAKKANTETSGRSDNGQAIDTLQPR